MKSSDHVDLEKNIRGFIERNLVLLDDEVALKNDDDIFDLGFVDSLFALQLISFLEETFAIEVNDQDLDISNFSSVVAIVAFVNKKKTLEV
ncbi:MAG: acyl carrier protein [Deltaproteobacteria bacterium]|nr:acyl carrier protein [Deltaproteobacteria bacterium]